MTGETTAETTAEMIGPGEAVKGAIVAAIGGEVMEAAAVVEECSQILATGAIGTGVKMDVVCKMMGRRRSKCLVK